MSFNLWKFLIEDDVDSFRQYLAYATYSHSAARIVTTSSASPALKIGSPSTLATSPRTPVKTRKSAGNLHPHSGGRTPGLVLTRAEINARDHLGRTILQHAAVSPSPNAIDFVRALLEIPVLDLYIQDNENGWTALHHALYAGNIQIAHALMRRDLQNVTDFATAQSQSHVGGLIKIKDREGNSPFEVFGLTIAPRSLQEASSGLSIDTGDDESVNSVDVGDDSHGGERNNGQVPSLVDLRGDEVFAFGSNRNLSLGLGDEDDRQFPERIHLERPEHLLHRLRDDSIAERQKSVPSEDLSASLIGRGRARELPAVIRNQPLNIQNVVMSKMHTAVLTTDPISNLYVCGFGPGGRLGTGDEATRFDYVCIQGGGLAKRRVSDIALGQYHTVALCSSGEVFTWGSNKYGQLGYALPEVSAKEVPMQLSPRQLYGLIKKEMIIGTAASSIHSVLFTSTGLYTFGKNEGQLGLTDADARSLEIQIIPRRVGVSILQSGITSVSAIDRATTVLLDNHDVIVFTNYAWTRVAFPFQENPLLFGHSLTPRINTEVNSICKITSGSNTVCALSSFGQVFTVEIPKRTEPTSSNVSTTNPNKAKNALPTPTRVWSIMKPHMSAVDAAVGQDGSIIICTGSGSIWKKEKRTSIKSGHKSRLEGGRPKDYKFVRVPNITRAIAVRSNAFGAFAAVRKDCDVTRDQILVDPPSLWQDLFPLLAFKTYGQVDRNKTDEDADQPQLRFWAPANNTPSPALVKRAILTNKNAEEDFLQLCKSFEMLPDSPYDIWITSNVTNVRIPVHSILLKGRSKVLRSALVTFQDSYYFSIPDVMSIEYAHDGQIQISFLGADFLTLVGFVFYVYTDNIIDVWHHTSRNLPLASRYRQVRIELMKIANHLELGQLERAVRVMVDPSTSMQSDFESANLDNHFHTDADILVELAEGTERPAHSAIFCARCPFFEGLFHGRAGGMWMSRRKADSEMESEPARVDLKHVEPRIFDMVSRHIYADTGEELFEDVVTKDLDEFIDVVIEVMSVANELMIDRLVQVCQKVLGKYVTTRNICGLLNAVAEGSVFEFKNAALEYICLNLESMLGEGLLDELDEYLLEELSDVVQQNQLAYMPFVRSNRAQAELIEKHPELAEELERARQRRIDSMRLGTRVVVDDEKPLSKARFGSYDKYSTSPIASRKAELMVKEEPSPHLSPAIPPSEGGEDLPFDMDEDRSSSVPPSPSPSRSPRLHPTHSQRRTSERPGLIAKDDVGSMADGLVTDQPGQRPSFPSSVVQYPTSNTAASGFELPKAAWNTSQKDSTTSLKQIMEQASTSRISHLTQAMHAAAVTPSKAATKVSQKERKRQQHQLKSQDVITKEDESTANVSPSPSPWIKVTSSPSVSLRHVLNDQSQPSTESRASPKPNMTMRQTVAGTPSKADSTPLESSRSVSSPSVTQASRPGPSQIQSIRHTPLPARSSSFVDAYSSMADILAQQQFEKVAIREAAAKRSLEEIQQEQEFQEWWDQESKRVQDEEAKAETAATRPEKASRGRGGRRRGSAKGTTAPASSGDSPGKKRSPNQQPPTDAKVEQGHGSSDRGRGGGLRGRGRGKPRHE